MLKQDAIDGNFLPLRAKLDQFDCKVEDEDHNDPQADKFYVRALIVIRVSKTRMASAVKVSVVILDTLVAEGAFVAICAFISAHAVVLPANLIAPDKSVRLL